jgi:putative ABC transport system permease protein
MEQLWQDLRYGLRILVRSPGFATVAVLTLAVGIAANTAIFSLVNAFFLRPLPFTNPEELVHIWQTDQQIGERELRVSVPNFLDWKDQTNTLDDLGGYFYSSFNVAGEEEPASVLVGRLTPNLLDILGVEPVLGRRFLPEEGETGKEKVVILSHGFWERHFASSPGALNETVVLDGEVYAVVGVMPPEFEFPLKKTQMWSPLPLEPYETRRESNGPLLVVGRLKAGVTMEEAQAELDTIMQRLEQEYAKENRAKGANIVPLRQALVFFYDLLQLTFAVLFMGVSFILLIVCANVGNLLLARATGRSREIAIRTAMGGGRGRLIRQLLTESTVLAFIGGVLGSIAAYWLVRLAGSNIPEDLYRVGVFSVDARSLVFTLAVSLGAALVFGLAPALQTTQPNLTETLKEGDRASSAGAKSRRLRSALVVAEVALAMVLLALSTLMVQSFVRLQHVDVGFNPENVLTLEIDIPPAKYTGDTETNQFFERALERVRALPGVQSAAEIYPLPLNFESMGIRFTIEGRPPLEPGEKLFANNFWSTTDTFRTMEIPLLRGRAFTGEDNEQAPRVVIINQTMAERYWPNQDPIGARIRLEPETEDEKIATVIGVVGNSKHFLMNEEAASLVYLPQLQESTHRRFLIVRTVAVDPLTLVDSVREQVWAVDPLLPVTTIRTMNQVITESLGPWSGGTAVIGLLGFVAILLATMGLYGVISFSVGQRTHEMGLRMALGAQRRSIVRLVLKQGIRLTVIGVVIGVALSVALSRVMQALLYGVDALDPLTFIGMPLVLVAVALTATTIPALRATRIDPITALRYE